MIRTKLKIVVKKKKLEILNNYYCQFYNFCPNMQDGDQSSCYSFLKLIKPTQDEK